MESKLAKRKVAETIAGAAIGAAVAGPVGAVAGGLAASQLDPALIRTRHKLRSEARAATAPDDPLIHAFPERILVPLDFSLPSKRTLRFAREWAEFFAAEVYLLHVVEPTTASCEFEGVPLGAVQPDILAKAKAALRELVRTEFPRSIRTHATARKGNASEQIAAFARARGVNLIILATHGRSGLKRALLGSTAEHVVRHAPCPVLILRREATPTNPDSGIDNAKASEIQS